MTESNNIVQPKPGRGRPKKYFTEERKRANNGYTKKYFLSVSFIIFKILH